MGVYEVSSSSPITAMTRPDDLVVDHYIGVGTAACAAVLHGRHAARAYVAEA